MIGIYKSPHSAFHVTHRKSGEKTKISFFVLLNFLYSGIFSSRERVEIYLKIESREKISAKWIESDFSVWCGGWDENSGGGCWGWKRDVVDDDDDDVDVVEEFGVMLRVGGVRVSGWVWRKWNTRKSLTIHDMKRRWELESHFLQQIQQRQTSRIWEGAKRRKGKFSVFMIFSPCSPFFSFSFASSAHFQYI